MKRTIEDSFPIVEINRLARPERNAFKPIYQMHKWFARRASCVFRAILLGALKPLPLDENGKPLKSGAEVIMDEFYKDHTHDPDTNGKVVLDPFMGGGTTIVESLRLGCKAIGIDLNPVAWFIVKTEIEPVDLDELSAAFDRLSESPVEWSGKPLKETLLELYKTKCPSCGGDADIIYTFWVKSAICTDQNCGKEVPLYRNFIISQKKPSIRYLEDCQCPECGKVFDWEIEPAALISCPQLRINAGKYSAGQGRTTARWSYGFARKIAHGGLQGTAICPWCKKEVSPRPYVNKVKRKKVEVAVLLCPKCEEVWQFRGPLPDKVECPSCKHEYNPKDGNIPSNGKFQCSCGNVGKIIDSIRSLPSDRLLPIHPYGIEAYCQFCARKPDDDKQEAQPDLFDPKPEKDIPHINQNSILWKNKGKYFKRLETDDLALYQRACELWKKYKDTLPYPKSKIPPGQETNRLIQHHYLYWHQMFNSRQLLELATLLNAITKEENNTIKEMLLCAFSATLERNNMFCRYFNDRNTIQGNFDRHDFAPKLTPAENSLFQSVNIRGTFPNMFKRMSGGKKYCTNIYDNDRLTPLSRIRYSSESIYSGLSELSCDDSRNVLSDHKRKCDLVITDPPYAGNVNYSELSDFYYVWLRLALKDLFTQFSPEYVPKMSEIIENPTRGKSSEDFKNGLKQVFSKCLDCISSDGILVFTFHHAKSSAWISVLEALYEAGFILLAAYPIHGEKESSLNLMDTTGISYDLIHVCKKRESNRSRRSWAGIRQKIRERARAEIALIESGHYGNKGISLTDCNIVLIGKCLEFYSRYYGKIVDHENNPVLLHDALEEIKMMVDQLINKENELPAELEDIDAPSYVYLTCLCDHREIKSDEVYKSTRGILEPLTLMERDLMIKGRAKRGRTYEVKAPVERLDLLKQKFNTNQTRNQFELFDEDLSVVVSNLIFIDYVHFLIGLVETGESVMEWLEKFRGRRPEIRAALEYMAKKNKNFTEPIRKILGLMDEKTLFSNNEVNDA